MSIDIYLSLFPLSFFLSRYIPVSLPSLFRSPLLFFQSPFNNLQSLETSKPRSINVAQAATDLLLSHMKTKATPVPKPTRPTPAQPQTPATTTATKLFQQQLQHQQQQAHHTQQLEEVAGSQEAEGVDIEVQLEPRDNDNDLESEVDLTPEKEQFTRANGTIHILKSTTASSEH